LLHNIADELEQGKIVKLDKLGSFQIGIRSEGVATEVELSASAIKKAHINFRPDKRLRNMLANVNFTFSK
jgi:predicted histone-like DNA-binding protein